MFTFELIDARDVKVGDYILVVTSKGYVRVDTVVGINDNDHFLTEVTARCRTFTNRGDWWDTDIINVVTLDHYVRVIR